MRILSWNCNGAFRKKVHLLEKLQLDIAIIQECEKLEHWDQLGAYDWLWQGERTSKGLGVFSFNSETKLKALPMPVEHNHWFLPFKVNQSIQIMAVWAMNHRNNPVIDNIQPTYRTITTHSAIFKEMDLIAGDFNNNVLWDKGPSRKYDKGLFSESLEVLSKMKLESLYHHSTGEQFGEESKATLYLQRNLQKPYHVDYAFVKKELLPRTNFRELEEKFWLEASDHMPLFIEIGT